MAGGNSNVFRQIDFEGYKLTKLNFELRYLRGG